MAENKIPTFAEANKIKKNNVKSQTLLIFKDISQKKKIIITPKHFD